MAALASSSSCNSVEGPVLSVINKRLRALRKKLNRITAIEESVSQGKTLNKEQEETLRSKSSVLAGIDELEKLQQPLSQAVEQEIQRAVEKNLVSDVQNSGLQARESGSEVDARVSAVSDLVNLLYFGNIFDLKTLMAAHDNTLTRIHERNCCLTYDYVTDDDSAGDPLKEWDLDLISMLGGLVISRPVNSSSSHTDSLQKCMEHAKLWIANSHQPIDPNSNITYAYLKKKLNKIMTSEYFTTSPEIRVAAEVSAVPGNYTSLQAPLQSSVVPSVAVPDYVDGENSHQVAQSLNSHNGETNHDENAAVKDFHQGISQEEKAPEVEEVHKESDSVDDPKLDQNIEQRQSSRIPYQNYRGRHGGGGYRAYNNNGGRGWRGGSRGGYPNGHSHFYDQPNGYYPRNNHFRGRGGRGISPDYAQVGRVEAAS